MGKHTYMYIGYAGAKLLFFFDIRKLKFKSIHHKYLI